MLFLMSLLKLDYRQKHASRLERQEDHSRNKSLRDLWSADGYQARLRGVQNNIYIFGWLFIVTVVKQGHPTRKYRKTLQMQFSSFSYRFMVFLRDIFAS